MAARRALARGADPVAGATVSASVATVVCLAATVGRGPAPGGSLLALLPFAAIGVAVPGVSQFLYFRSVRDVGASRAGIVVSAAPLLSVLVAVAVLGERPHVAVAAGTVLIVCAGVLLAWEPVRPHYFRLVGVFAGVACAALFALRDNVIRWANEAAVDPLLGATVSLAAGALVMLVYLASRGPAAAAVRIRTALRAFAPVGAFFGAAYGALVTAFDRGSVSVVAPLNATHALWTVLLAALVLRGTEAIGSSLVVAAALVVGGTALIGVFR